MTTVGVSVVGVSVVLDTDVVLDTASKASNSARVMVAGGGMALLSTL